jgi:ketosteroid isomerase-like protein
MRISLSSKAALIVSVCLLLGLAGLMTAQEDDAGRVRALEMKWSESYKQHKIDILASLLAEDFVITVEDGTPYSKSGYITHSADNSTDVDIATVSELKVHLRGNVAVVTGAYHEKGRSNGKPYEYRDRLTDVWMKKEGNWQVIASHYSVPVK